MSAANLARSGSGQFSSRLLYKLLGDVSWVRTDSQSLSVTSLSGAGLENKHTWSFYANDKTASPNVLCVGVIYYLPFIVIWYFTTNFSTSWPCKSIEREYDRNAASLIVSRYQSKRQTYTIITRATCPCLHRSVGDTNLVVVSYDKQIYNNTGSCTLV